METLLQDLRFAARSFLRSPRFTIPAVLALALGIGSTSAIFSVVRGVMLKPLPYSDPDRIVVVWESNLSRGRLRNVIGPANFVEWRNRNTSFSALGMAGPARLNVMLGNQPEEISGMAFSADAFNALGVQPAHGRAYTPAEDIEGNDAVIVITHEFWQTRLGGRPDIVGTTLTTNGRTRNVVGVMPPQFTVVGEKVNFLVPYGWTEARLRAAAGRGSSFAVARLREGVSFERASQEMKTIAAQLEREAPQRNTNWSVTLVPVHEQMVDQIRPALLVLAAAVLLVLLVACVNVANLLLARSNARERELGIRAALGAARGRLVRQMLSESLLLAAAGGIAGIALAYAFHRGLLALVANRIPVPRLDQVALDWTTMAATLLLALGTGILFGLVPSLLISTTVNDSLRGTGREGGSPRSRRTLSGLVVGEVALSVLLLAGAGLLIRSFMHLQNVDPGFGADGVLTARVQLPGTRYNDPVKSAAFFTNALERIETLPGVSSAAGVSFLPMAGPGMATSFYRTDRPTPPPGAAATTQVRPVTPGFFRTMGIPHVKGRDFSSSDTAESPLVAIVSETLVKRQFEGEDPVGKRLHVNIGRAGGMNCEIVGVVGDITFGSLDSIKDAAVYIPHTQLSIGLMTFVVRSERDPLQLVTSISTIVRGIDPELPLADVRTMGDVVDATLARPRTVSVLLTSFALMALVLAGVGVYGVMAYSVSQRTREMGVRMALGATPQSILRLVMGESLRIVLLGVAAGLTAAVALTRLLETMLFETGARDPWTLAFTAAVLVLVALVASYVPARRGTRVAPVEALRAE